jgi:hypothetical protein
LKRYITATAIATPTTSVKSLTIVSKDCTTFASAGTNLCVVEFASENLENLLV